MSDAPKSKGKIKVNLFPGAQLGNDQFHVSGVQGGTIEMSVMNSGILASQAKEFAVFYPEVHANFDLLLALTAKLWQ